MNNFTFENESECCTFSNNILVAILPLTCNLILLKVCENVLQKSSKCWDILSFHSKPMTVRLSLHCTLCFLSSLLKDPAAAFIFAKVSGVIMFKARDCFLLFSGYSEQLALSRVSSSIQIISLKGLLLTLTILVAGFIFYVSNWRKKAHKKLKLRCDDWFLKTTPPQQKFVSWVLGFIVLQETCDIHGK